MMSNIAIPIPFDGIPSQSTGLIAAVSETEIHDYDNHVHGIRDNGEMHGRNHQILGVVYLDYGIVTKLSAV